LLCLSRKRVEQLISAGVLKIIGGCPQTGEKWLIDYDSIIALAPATFLSAPSENFITISQAAKHYLPTAGGLPQLMTAIQSGEIPVFCRAESESVSVGKWLVNSNELELKGLTLHTSSQAKGMSVSDAAKILGVKEEVAYALVRLGRLGSETVQCSRRSAQVVSLKAIQHFKRNYIFAPEIGLILATSVKNVRYQLWRRGFRPVAGPNLLNAQCRQNVWRRSKKLAAYLTSVAVPDKISVLPAVKDEYDARDDYPLSQRHSDSR